MDTTQTSRFRKMKPVRRMVPFPKIMKKMRKNWKMLFLTGVFILGTLCGVILNSTSSQTVSDKLASILKSYMEARNTESFFMGFLHSMLSSFILAVITFFMGLSSFSVPFIVLIPYIRGLGVGMLAGFLYSTYALKGVGYCMLMIIPYTTISVLALILCCRESMRMSIEISRVFKKNNAKSSLKGDFKLYCARFGAFMVIFILAALVDAFFSSAFAHFFVF